MNRILTTKPAAEYCGISVQHLYNLLSRGEGPVSYKHGSRNVFYEADLDAWITSRLSPRPERVKRGESDVS